jgi:hypothetical protein
MALVPTDWKVTRSTGFIEYVGGDHDGTGGTPSYATVIDFHRWLQGLADDAVASLDDQLDITNTLPSQRSTDNIITLINGYNIDDEGAEHLYDGSVIQNAGDDVYDGIVNFGNADVQIQIIQNGAVLADDWWNYNGAGLNADATSGISHRFMIKTVSGGNPIDNRKIIGTCRRFNYTYSEFTINATARGNNVLALTDSSDLNNATSSATVATWSADYSNTEGYATIDVDNDGLTTTEDHYYSNWNLDTGTHPSINDFYEYTKYLTRDGSAATLYGLSGELFRGITHQVTISSPTGTFVQPESLSWGTGATAGTAQLLAIDSTTAGTKMWIQLLTGAPPTGTITGNGLATATTGTVTEKSISKPFVGASTGSALIGSYGLGIVATDLSASDKLTDLEGNLQQPPNFVTNTVSGIVSTEDRVLVAPWDGSTTDTNLDPAINKAQMTIATTALTTDNVTSITVSDIDPSIHYPPSSGYIRVVDNNGFERRLHYSSLNATTNVFTIDTTDGNEDFATVNANIGNNVYFAYIDELASSTSATFTSVHSSGTMSLVVVVRDGGGTPIKQFISGWTQTSSNQTINVIRTSDT